MIKTIEKYHCTKCGSDTIRKNGFTGSGKQKYHCKACNSYGSIDPQRGYSQEQRELVLNAYLERTSLRGLERIFGISRQTIAAWISGDTAKSQ